MRESTISKRKGYFKGYYLKHYKNGKTIAFIPGRSNDSSFVQVVTNDFSRNFLLPAVKTSGNLILGDCYFSPQGICVDLPGIKADIKYFNLTPPAYDIMGPFKFFSMECSHGVLSLHHRLQGKAVVYGEKIDFTDGIGYIEYDSGCSFPKEYLWLHCNDFPQKCSVMVSVALVPFMRKVFRGCVCIVYYGGKEYRLATYNGVKVLQADEKRISLRSSCRILDIEIKGNLSHPLYAPLEGHMSETIKECNNASGVFRFYNNNKLVFEYKSDNVSFESRKNN